MVVPLKLTQFYGHNVPRPQVYSDVKFSEQRVDPPASVNEALLSWASDAHWSMGGLSIKRLRAQGKVEGSLRRLRAFREDDDDAANGGGADDLSDATVRKEVSKHADSADTMKSPTGKESSKRVEEIGEQGEEEAVEALPVRKLRRREMVCGGSKKGSPVVSAATEEKPQKGKARSVPVDVRDADLPSNVRRKAMRSTIQVDPPVEAVHDTREMRRVKICSATVKNMCGSKSPVSTENPSSEGSLTRQGGRLTRSAKVFSEGGPGSPLQWRPCRRL
eukprot:c22853_g2_i1 orf=138-965(+)